MHRIALSLSVCAAVLLATASHHTPVASADDALGKDIVLKAADINARLVPETVFFRGQTAPTQLRNSGGVHFGDDAYVLAALVDSSGYSTGIREKYQAYLLAEVALDFGGQTLPPGAYGFGFINGGKLVVMDLGAHDVLQISSQRDAELKRPVPMQVVTGAASGVYRLYVGRDYVEFRRSR
jgi:hypothetical protein